MTITFINLFYTVYGFAEIIIWQLSINNLVQAVFKTVTSFWTPEEQRG